MTTNTQDLDARFRANGDRLDAAREKRDTLRARLDEHWTRLRTWTQDETSVNRAIAEAVARGEDPEALREARAALRERLHDAHAAVPTIETWIAEAERDMEVAALERRSLDFEGAAADVVAKTAALDDAAERFVTALNETKAATDRLFALAASEGFGVANLWKTGDVVGHWLAEHVRGIGLERSEVSRRLRGVRLGAKYAELAIGYRERMAHKARVICAGGVVTETAPTIPHDDLVDESEPIPADVVVRGRRKVISA